MNDDEFKKKLDEIAVWYIPILGNECAKTVNEQYLRKPRDNQIKHINPGIGPKIENFINRKNICDYCPRTDVNPTFRIHRLSGKWQKYCNMCKKEIKE